MGEEDRKEGTGNTKEKDDKPKILISIALEGSTIQMRMKLTQNMSKLMEAAEKSFGKDPGTLKFTFDGQRVNKDDTPASLGIEEGDQVDAHLEQIGGRL